MWAIAAVEVVDDPDSELQGQELGGEVGLGGRPRPGQERPAPARRAASTTPVQRPAHRGQELVGDVRVHEQGLGRIADARPLRLGIHDDALGHGEIGGGVHIDVAVAVPVEHVGNRGVLEDHREQRRAPAGIRQSMSPRSRTNSTAVSCEVSSTSTRRRPAGRPCRSPGASDEAMTRFDSRAPGGTPQQGRVAGLQAQGGRVGGDVRAVLVDDPDDAERDTDALDSQPVRAHVALDDLADRIGRGPRRRADRSPSRRCGPRTDGAGRPRSSAPAFD